GGVGRSSSSSSDGGPSSSSRGSSWGSLVPCYSSSLAKKAKLTKGDQISPRSKPGPGAGRNSIASHSSSSSSSDNKPTIATTTNTSTIITSTNTSSNTIITSTNTSSSRIITKVPTITITKTPASSNTTTTNNNNNNNNTNNTTSTIITTSSNILRINTAAAAAATTKPAKISDTTTTTTATNTTTNNTATTTSCTTTYTTTGTTTDTTTTTITPNTNIIKNSRQGAEIAAVGSSPFNFNVPLAESCRPKTLEFFVGQQKSLGEGSFLRRILRQGSLPPSMIFWGPPGSGKTTLAKLISRQCQENQLARHLTLSATNSGVNNIKQAAQTAKTNRSMFRMPTVLFIDEIHRFNKTQQDSLLPHVEDGTFILLGATTENPSFHVNAAL
ncbi:hypothetical protein Ahia01_001402900, partial [Argonauta hians]